MKRRIVPGGILALSLAVVLLAATASTASADRGLFLWCGPLPTAPTTFEQTPDGCIEDGDGEPSFDFGDRQVGTTSPAQGFALSLINDTFNPRISVSGDYTLASFGYDFGTGVLDNNCSATEYCIITVTFTPTGTGPKHGTLSTGPGGPTATLTGNGVTTPTPPVLPLSLDVSVKSPQTLRQLGGKGVVRAISAQTNLRPYYAEGSTTPAHYDTKLVLRGDVKKTTKQLTANVPYEDPIKARLKHLNRLREEPTKPKIKIKFVATDEFGQTATEERKVTLCSRLIRIDREHHRCLWHPSRK